MKAWLMALALSRRPQTYTQTYAANTTFPVPVDVASVNLSGYGAAGTPGTAGTPSRTGWYVIITDTFHRRDGGPADQTASQGPNVFDGSPKPSNYCDPTVFYTMDQSAVYSDGTRCYNYYTVTDPGTPSTPPTTGASTTGFGKTFPGGTGGAASTTIFSNVTVTPGANYSLVIPSGGSLTVTYTR